MASTHEVYTVTDWQMSLFLFSTMIICTWTKVDNNH